MVHKPGFRLLVQCSGLAGRGVRGAWGGQLMGPSLGFHSSICKMGMIMEEFTLRTVPGPL